MRLQRITELEDVVSTLQDELEAVRTRNKTLVSEIRELRTDLDHQVKIAADSVELQDQVQTLKKKVLDLQAANAAASDQQQSQSQSQPKLGDIAEFYETKIKSLKRAHDDEMTNLLMQLESCRVQIRELQECIDSNLSLAHAQLFKSTMQSLQAEIGDEFLHKRLEEQEVRRAAVMALVAPTVVRM